MRRRFKENMDRVGALQMKRAALVFETLTDRRREHMDSSMAKMTRKLSLAMVVVGALVLAMGMPGQAAAATCTDVGGFDVAGDCTISTPITGICPFNLTVPGDLKITSAGSITCSDPAAPITIDVGGDMEMLAGSAIRAEDTVAGGSGGNITLTVAGNFTMRNGAVISSSKTAGAGDTGVAGDIRITVGNVTVNEANDTITCATTPAGDILVENGAQILANGTGEAGAIKMFAGKNATINGLVSSQGLETAKGRGGPITIDACCDLVIGDTGIVISKGRDPGADLVHLQACVIEIFGLVASTGAGHEDFTGNLCNVNRPGKPANSSACIEIWAGTTLLIDSTGAHNGEVNADTATAGGTQGGSWIDLLANGAITIRGITTPAPAAGNNDTNPVFAVHANQILQNGHGGAITVISTDSTVTTTGRAVQANASTASNGGTGGKIVVLAAGEVAFGTGATPAFIEAAGDTNSTGAGGTITAQSFTANVSGPAGSQLKVDGPAAHIGTVTLTGCANPAGTYLGQVLPAAARVNVTACPGGSPPLPVPANTAIFPLAACANTCGALPAGNKSGVKFNDLNKNGVQDGVEPGLIGWTIHVFDTATKALLQSTVTAAANAGPPATPDGFYSFTLGPGSYTVCEALQSGWQQTAPLAVPPPAGETLADCAPFGAANLLTLGPRGYNFTIVSTEVFSGNNFGNFQPPGECPEDPLRASKIKHVVDETGTSHGPAPVYLTVQAAYNAAGNGEVIGLFSKTIENVVLGGAKTLTITQCTLARITAQTDAPVMDITSTGKLTIIGPDTHGGTIGWRVGGNGGHTLKSIRADGATQYGVQVLSSSNGISWNSLNGNAVGLRVETGSNSNTLSGGNVSSNTGDGVQIAGNNNTLKGAKIQSNTGNGVLISGTGNTIKSNKANKNTLAGFRTAATATGSKFGSNASNETSQNGTKENGGPEYDFAAGSAPVTNLFGNKADNVSIPTVTKCPTLFSLGGTCE
jgi:hypothetical protein